MAEEKRNEEQTTFVVADKRKFNVDGSLREGVKIEETKPKPPETPSAAAPKIDLPTDSAAKSAAKDDDFDETNIPGAENPASFANFLLSLASQAAAAMGMTENPMTGRRQADLELSRYWLDVLAMLREKVEGNLHPQEKKLFDSLLGDLRMQFVQLRRLADEQRRQQEEQLLKTAAQKFTGKDILGK
jgi:hypothetical protein